MTDCAFLSHNLPDKNYGSDLLVDNDTEKFDQLLDAETDVAVYGHVHKQLLRYGSQGQQIINPGSIGMPYFNWEALKNHRAQYAVIEIEDGELVNIHFRKVAYAYEAELELAKSQGLPLSKCMKNYVVKTIIRAQSGTISKLNRKVWVCRRCEEFLIFCKSSLR